MKIKIVAIFVILALTTLYLYFGSKDNTNDYPKCKDEVVCFDKVSGDAQNFLDFLHRDGASYESSIVESLYMPSSIRSHLSEETLLMILEDTFGAQNRDSIYSVTLKAYENDRDDPGKKSQKCKLFAGYLLLSLQKSNEEIYRIQIDMLESDFSDAKERLKCVKEVLEYRAR